MPPKKRGPVRENECVAKKRRGTNDTESGISEDYDERDTHYCVNILPNAECSGESDSDDSKEDSESLRPENEDENFEHHLSFEKVSENYNSSQKKLESNHEYVWLDGEKPGTKEKITYENEILLKSADAKMIVESSPTKLFEFFFSPELKNYIIEATSVTGLEISMDELDAFLGILIFTCYNKRLSQRDYWSNDKFLQAQPVREAMGRNKFVEIKKKLKLNKPDDENNNDRAWRVRQVLNIFRTNLTRFGIFGTALSVDEMMLKFFGRTVLKQFIKGKPIRFGLKMWALCSANGFLLDCDIYCGKNAYNDQQLAKCALGSRVVIQMLQKFFANVSARVIHKYHVYFDNLFTSPDLLVHLQRLGLRATGTVRENRVSTKHSIPKNADRGTYQVKHDANSNLHFITVKDSKPVSILSTATGVTPLSVVKRHIEKRKEKQELLFPNAFCIYNRFMGGVDLHDQRCNSISPSIRSKKWTWVILLRLIQSSITNATILYNTVAESAEKKSTRDFALEISKSYMTKKTTSKLQRHTVQKEKLLKNCNTKNCAIRTRKLCQQCNLYYCENCFKTVHNLSR